MSQTELLPWMAERWEYVIRLYDQARLPHAMMINGAKGIGKLAFAHRLAEFLLCQQHKYGQPCGECRGCQLTGSHGHPDLHLLEPEDAGKPIKVDQVRALIDVINSTAQQGGFRVVIVNPVHEMNVAAANALLKTLEEPGRDTVLLLVTDRLGQVMPTIKSRCQRLDCPQPEASQAKPWVAQQLNVDDEKAARYLAMANGSPLSALNFAEKDVQEMRAELVKGLADVLKQRRTVVEVATQWQKLDLEQLLGWLQSLVADLVRVVTTQDEASIQQTDALNMLRAMAQRVSTAKLFGFVDQVTEARKSLLLRQNPNKQLLVETLLLAWLGLASQR